MRRYCGRLYFLEIATTIPLTLHALLQFVLVFVPEGAIYGTTLVNLGKCCDSSGQ